MRCIPARTHRIICIKCGLHVYGIWHFMFASTYVHIIFCHLFLIPVLVMLCYVRMCVCVSMFCCLAIRSLVAFMCLLLFFPHILAFFHRRAHTEERSRSLSSVCITSCPPHFAHSLENWVQHDLFTIRKYVLWLQHPTDMIIFLCFLSFVRFHCDKLLLTCQWFDFTLFLSFSLRLWEGVSIFIWWEQKMPSIQAFQNRILF